MSLGESVSATEIKLNDGFLGQNFFGNQKIPGILTPRPQPSIQKIRR